MTSSRKFCLSKHVVVARCIEVLGLISHTNPQLNIPFIFGLHMSYKFLIQKLAKAALSVLLVVIALEGG